MTYKDYGWCRWWRRIQRARNGDKTEDGFFQQAQFYRFDEPFCMPRDEP